MKSLKEIYEHLTESNSIDDIDMGSGHTMWIDDNGKLIDISRTGKVHWKWAEEHPEKFKKKGDNIYQTTTMNGWIRVRNMADVQFYGRLRDLKKRKSVIQAIIDNRLFKRDPSSRHKHFFVDFTIMNDSGDVEKRVDFKLPDDDNKVRKFLR